MELKESEADQCIFYKISKQETLIIAVYVDDLLIFSSHEKLREDITQKLMTNFHMKDLGKIKQCIEMNVNKEEEKLNINQLTYLEEIIKRFNMQESKPV